MLNKQNRKLFKSFWGNYKKFARRLKNELFERCVGNEAINESLGDVFSMLAAAQDERRPFDEVIPDPDGFIKETALCFPSRRNRRLIAVLSGLLAITLVGGGAWVCISEYGPVTLERVTYVSYDEKNNYLYWEPIENAFEYDLYLNGDFYKTASGNGCFLTGVDSENVKISVAARAQEETRYRDGKVSKEFDVKPEYASVSLTLQNGVEYNSWRWDNEAEGYKWRCAYVSFGRKAYDVGKVYFTPEYNFYGKIKGYGYTPITALKENGEEIEYAEEMWYYSGKEYEFTLTREEHISWNDFGVSLNILNIRYAQGLTIPEGDTLFAKYAETEDFQAYREKSGKIAFAEAKEKDIINHDDFYDSFSTYDSWPYEKNFLIVRNEGTAKKLELVENKTTPEALDGELHFKKGYTAVEASDIWALTEAENNSGEEGYFCLYFKNQGNCTIINVEKTGEGASRYAEEYAPSSLTRWLFHRRISEEYLGRIIIYTEEDVTMYSQFLWDDDTVSVVERQQTLTLQPGVTVLSKKGGYARYLLTASSFIFVDKYFNYPFTAWQGGYEFLLRYELILFNPYDEPIEITAYGMDFS